MEAKPSYRMIALQVLAALLLASLQTTLWFQFFGQIPAPQLWLGWVVFIALHRPFFEALFMCYGFGLFMTAYSSSPLSLVWPALLILVAGISYGRNKVFWPGLRYFMIATLLASGAWHALVLILSSLLLEKPAPPMLIFRTLEVLMSFLAAPLVFVVMKATENLRPNDGRPTEIPEELV